jgi:hypothetical protein
MRLSEKPSWLSIFIELSETSNVNNYKEYIFESNDKLYTGFL